VSGRLIVIAATSDEPSFLPEIRLVDVNGEKLDNRENRPLEARRLWQRRLRRHIRFRDTVLGAVARTSSEYDAHDLCVDGQSRTNNYPSKIYLKSNRIVFVIPPRWVKDVPNVWTWQLIVNFPVQESARVLPQIMPTTVAITTSPRYNW